MWINEGKKIGVKRILVFVNKKENKEKILFLEAFFLFKKKCVFN